MSNIKIKLIRELKLHAKPGYKKSSQRFFRERIMMLGVRVGTVRRLGREYWPEIEPQGKEYVFNLAEELLKTDLQEMAIIAFQWASKWEFKFTPSDFNIFESWLKHYVNNWAKCDDLCIGPLGKFLVKYPQAVKKTVPWRKSKNRWVRRGAAVSLIRLARSGKNLKDVFATSDAMLLDHDDMAQKGYGWLLKEASNVYPKAVFDFVMNRKSKMPRTALRYAIEKLSITKRKQAMQ